MGIGPPILSLYHQLARDGLLKDVREIMEFGSQEMHCKDYQNIINAVVIAMGKQPFPRDQVMTLANAGPARHFYERLGWRYNCIDTDGRHGALVLDLNFDAAPTEHRLRYDLTTNYGTTEHLVNQLNAFQVLHDLTKPGGLILHILPFVGCLDHGFFNYQPNFFYALARFNSYDILGMWFNANTALSSLIPWQHGLLRYIQVSPMNDSVLIVAIRKMFDAKFCVPFQNWYEFEQTNENMARYDYIIDGEILNGNRVAYLRLGGPPNVSQQQPLSPDMANQIPGHVLVRELLRRVRNRLRLL